MSASCGNALKELIALLSAIASQEDAVQHAIICAALGSTVSSGTLRPRSPPLYCLRAPPQWPRALDPARQRDRSSPSGRRGASASRASPSLWTLAFGAVCGLPPLALAFRPRQLRHRPLSRARRQRLREAQVVVAPPRQRPTFLTPPSHRALPHPACSPCLCCASSRRCFTRPAPGSLSRPPTTGEGSSCFFQ